MRNIILVHLESLNYMNYHMNKEYFPTLYKWEKKSLSFSNYYSTATSTLMLLSDMAYGGMLQNEPCDTLLDKLQKYCYESSLLDELGKQGYCVRAIDYPANGTDVEGLNKKNFMGYSVQLEEMTSYEDYLDALNETISQEVPFVLWVCNYISNISFNRYMQNADSRSGLDRWEKAYVYMDSCVNKLLEIVKGKDLLNNTTIIFYGDHGDDLFLHGKHKGLSHAIEPYATLIHTPFWIYDNRFRGGNVINQMVSAVDVRELIDQLLTLPNTKLKINNIKLPIREYALSRNVYAAQKVREGSFNKGYSLTNGEFLLLASNNGMELYQIKMDPTCHHNLLEYFTFDNDIIGIDEMKYKMMRYHLPYLLDADAFLHIKQVFFDFRNKLMDEVLKLYKYAEVEDRISEIQFNKINYEVSQANIEDDSNEPEDHLISQVVNRLLNNMRIRKLAVYGHIKEELDGIYSSIDICSIAHLKDSNEYKVCFIAFEDFDECWEVLPWILENKKNHTILLYIRNQDSIYGKSTYLPDGCCICDNSNLMRGILYGFGEIIEYNDSFSPPKDFKVLAIMHFYNEVDILEMTIKYLLSQDIDIYLVDNWSNDGGFEIAQKYANLYPNRIFLERFPKEGKNDYYDWYHQLERTEQIAEEKDYDWYIHYDTDEMRFGPWKNKNLRETIGYIDYLGYNLVENTVIDFRLTENNDANIFMTDTYFDFRHFLAGFHQRKTWKKSKTLDLKRTGGHIAKVENPRIFPLKILNRHYPLRSIEQARKKVFQDRKPRFVKEQTERGWHGHYDHIEEDKDLLFDKAELILWNNNTWNNYYIPLFIGCGIQISDRPEKFDENINYLFGKKIVLYGAGKCGQYYIQKLAGQAEIVAWVDRDYVYIPHIYCMEISSPDCIKDVDFDLLFIAIQDKTIRQKIKEYLISYGVPNRKIF